MKNNGILLNLVRTIKGVSLEQLSVSSGFSKGLLSRYESGERPLSDERLVVLCRKLGVEKGLVDILLAHGVNSENKELAQKLGVILLKELEKAHNESKAE